MADVEDRASETQLRITAALDAVGDAILVLDATPRSRGGPLIAHANAAWLRAFGYAASVAIGTPAAQILAPADTLAEPEAIEGETERELLVRDGRGVLTEWPVRTGALIGPSGTALGRIFVARSSAGQRDREDLDVLRTAFAHTNDSIIVYERPVSGRRARIVYVNEATIRQSGFSREELVSGSTGIGPLTDLSVVGALRDAMLHGEPIRTRLALYRKDGSMYWGEIDGRPVVDTKGPARHWISIERDITDAFERERALSALLDASRLMFGELEGTLLDGRFLTALRTVLGAEAAIVGGEGDTLTQRALAAGTVVTDERGRLAIALRAPGREPRVAVVTLTASPHGNADERAVLALLAQIYAAAGRNAALFDEVHHQRAAVLELSRLKGDLITMLAHDLNNPLTAIRGFAEFLAEELVHDQEAIVATNTILRAVDRLSVLGKETLTLARLEDNVLVVTPAPIDYGELIAQIAQEAPRAVMLGVRGDLRGNADAILMRGLFENLIGNAIKYSRAGTPVTVDVRDDGPTIVVTVEDRGIGIPRDELGRVFDRFARASNARDAEIPGTGVGLYLARLIVQRHHGELTIESRLDEGTRVVVRLPRTPPATAAPCVLVFEPDEQAASYTEHVLRDAGYRVRVARELSVFERALREDDVKIAIVPEGSGPACDVARVAGMHVVELRKPYLARDLLRDVHATQPTAASGP
jgi:PAS domain S-box-containing protein